MSDNLKVFAEAFADQLKLHGEYLLDGLAVDNERFIDAMSIDMAAATLHGDQAAIDEILAQAKSLAEKHRVKASDSAWELFMESAGGTVGLVTLALRIVRGVL